jgi:RimJ/RimL family protein N-acetyltransferase
MMLMDFTMKDGKVVTIRPYQPVDFEAMVSMFQQSSEEALRFMLPPYDRSRLERWVSGLRDGVILLAVHESRLVGVGGVSGRAHPRYRGHCDFVTYVHQDYHGKGLGTFLTKMIVEEAKSKGFHRITLRVVVENVLAIKAYKRAGFVEEGRMKDAFLDDHGKYHDELVMGLIL